jgi:hypothetical protein
VGGQVGIGVPACKCSALDYMWVHEPKYQTQNAVKIFYDKLATLR